MQQKLPIGISSFKRLREEGCVYVDKTKFAFELIDSGHRLFFLSRPRRFGKSLFFSMLKEVLSGNKSIFNNLWIAKSSYLWKAHGVITLDLSSLATTSSQAFQNDLCSLLKTNARDLGITILTTQNYPEPILRELVRSIHAKFGAVAILVDEYDFPILHTLHKSSLVVEM